jgi:hypothetical protein
MESGAYGKQKQQLGWKIREAGLGGVFSNHYNPAKGRWIPGMCRVVLRSVYIFNFCLDIRCDFPGTIEDKVDLLQDN